MLRGFGDATFNNKVFKEGREREENEPRSLVNHPLQLVVVKQLSIIEYESVLFGFC